MNGFFGAKGSMFATFAVQELTAKHAKIGFKEIQLFWFFHE
jgi:hypothetical protein